MENTDGRVAQEWQVERQQLLVKEKKA